MSPRPRPTSPLPMSGRAMSPPRVSCAQRSRSPSPDQRGPGGGFADRNRGVAAAFPGAAGGVGGTP
eukprot:3635416-Rhodomonas_salina.1